jgi:hypothetical protein
MKRNASPAAPATAFDEWEEADRDDLKEVGFPIDLHGNIERSVRLRFAFQNAGYVVKLIESAIQHPSVWIIRAVRTTPQRIPEYQPFFRHIRKMLRQAGFRVKRDELTVGQTGNRVLVAFSSEKVVPNFEEILREPQGDVVDYQAMPL